jgi:hypothetical protein
MLGALSAITVSKGLKFYGAFHSYFSGFSRPELSESILPLGN